MDVCPAVTLDLTPTEQLELEGIKMHKKELLDDIQRLKKEIADVIAEIEDFEHTEESKQVQKTKQVACGKKKFNMDPQKVSVAMTISGVIVVEYMGPDE
ncbi:cytohesin-4-like [Protopterus annectens]|uniref:cytohesin-4-like n=1 Tax=Protopterus annectens TaxID=7888 RepID=UPI001CFBE7B2|nr:cytohesin-4-like [Protopterus annectens]